MKTETVVLDEVAAARLRTAIEREAPGLLQVVHRKVIAGIVVRDLDDVAPPTPGDDGPVPETTAPPKAKGKRG